MLVCATKDCGYKKELDEDEAEALGAATPGAPATASEGDGEAADNGEAKPKAEPKPKAEAKPKAKAEEKPKAKAKTEKRASR
jgi:DNA topoisomerase-1